MFLSLVVVCVVHAIFVMILFDWDSNSAVRLRENEINILHLEDLNHSILSYFGCVQNYLKIEGILKIVHVVY